MIFMNSNKYRASFIIGISFLLLFGISQLPFSLGHSPSSMTLTYDNPTQNLTVAITHMVSDPSTHYVENVAIEKNDIEIISMDYTSQPSNQQISYVYLVNTTEGDILKVTASCNQGGSITKEITITLDSDDDTTDDDTTDASDDDSTNTVPGFPIVAFLAIAFGGIILVGLRYTHRNT